MASTLIVDQHRKPLGRMRGFSNVLSAYVDDMGVPWLPIDGYSFYQLSQHTAAQMARNQELEQEIAKLKGNTNAN